MKRKVIQDILIGVFAALAMLMLVLTVMDLSPKQREGLVIREAFSVSSSPLQADGSAYESILQGVLANRDGEAVTVARMAVTVSDGEKNYVWETGAFEIEKRSNYPIQFKMKGDTDYKVVSEIVLYDGNGERLALQEDTGTATALGLICAIGFFVFAALTVWAGKVRYYLWQEDKMKG